MNYPGYACSAYAESWGEFGIPRHFAKSNGWVLERSIPDSTARDAMGCYPIFSCGDWSKLHSDIEDLGDELVSLSMIADPFGDYDIAHLRECFPDLLVPYKQHYVIDMHRPIDEIVSRHHRRAAGKAQKKIQSEVCPDPASFLDEWIELHENLVAKHDITGMRAFSRSSFKKQLNTPGLVLLKAKCEKETVGAQLWFQHENVAFGHVLAFSELGYKLGATYALYWFALNYFSDKVKWCDIGGVAGHKESARDGLGQFKDGWSTGRKTAYLCGRILNRSRYQELEKRVNASTDFFPAYRNFF
ncbi:MAG: GNAT family N-acetyltransferase [Halioglobus sp.]